MFVTHMTIQYYTIIPHPTDRSVLLLSTDEGWTLPNFRTEERHFWQDVSHINSAIQAQLSLDVTTLRAVHLNYDEDTDTSIQVYGMDNHCRDWVLPPYACCSVVPPGDPGRHGTTLGNALYDPFFYRSSV